MVVMHNQCKCTSRQLGEKNDEKVGKEKIVEKSVWEEEKREKRKKRKVVVKLKMIQIASTK